MVWSDFRMVLESFSFPNRFPNNLSFTITTYLKLHKNLDMPSIKNPYIHTAAHI
jgi:hypothetical protein